MLRRFSLDTRFRGYDGTRDGFVLIPAQLFSKEDTKIEKFRVWIIRNLTEDNIRAVLSVADHPKAASTDPNDFFDNRFIKELEDSGFIKELYGHR